MMEGWEEDLESGATPGPEEALQREIEKSKLLKVERLKLQNEIKQLQEENLTLLKKMRALKEKLQLTTPSLTSKPMEEKYFIKNNIGQDSPRLLTWFILILILLIMGWFSYFF